MQSDVEALEKVVEWLDGLNLGNPTDRLHNYLASIRQQLPLPADMAEQAKMGFTFLEAREFVSVCSAYRGAETPALIAKLKTVLCGSPSLLEESVKNSDARNTMFEISLAAELRLRGVDAELGEPDLVISLPGGQYVLECKRPFRETGLESNVKDANRQLRKNLRLGQRGVIAISLSRIVNPGKTLPYIDVENQDPQGVVHGNLQADLGRKCIRLMGDHLSEINFSPNIVALMFDLSTPYRTEEGEGLMHGSRFYPTDEPKVIRGKSVTSGNPSRTFTYLEMTINKLLENDLSPEAHAVTALIDLRSQLPPGVAVAISKNKADPLPMEIMFMGDFKSRK